MAELIFAEQTQAFEYFEEMGLYVWQPTDETQIFALAEGQTYTVLWDGTPYSATAKEMSLDGITGIGLGNEGIVGIGEDNGQPFIFAYLSDIGTNGMNACYSTAEGDTHTIAIYKGVLTKGANIVLYDRNGQPVTYEGIETVSFNTAEGDIATYTHGTATDEVAVSLDLSAGNQTVTPAEADFMKTVVIEKPETLLPENIAKDVNIAGVVGTLESGGDTAEGVSKEVELNLADGDQTVKPDANTLLSEVIIKKPDTLLPENIAKDVEIAGIVGTHEGGGGVTVSVSSSDINFYDYDGTIVAAWTLEELAAATELPDNPEHEGLISQGWNWTLADLKTTNRAMGVGQMYITNDGKTRLYISIVTEGRMTVPLRFTQTVANGVTIDWGDGSETETLSGTGFVNATHTYESIGDYVISLETADGCTLGLGTTNVGALPSGAYSGMLRRVEIGDGVTSIDTYSFIDCYALKSITIPNSVTSIGSRAFQNCFALASIIIPSGFSSLSGSMAFATCHALMSISIPNSVTSIGEYLFQDCYNLKKIEVSNRVTSIGTYAFKNCGTLTSVTIPSGVTSIANSAFYSCGGMAEYHLKPTTPPTLGGSSVFTSIPYDCIIYVPKGCLSAYQTATNWSTHKSKMQEEPE